MGDIHVKIRFVTRLNSLKSNLSTDQLKTNLRSHEESKSESSKNKPGGKIAFGCDPIELAGQLRFEEPPGY
jgi:hypothetical protein